MLCIQKLVICFLKVIFLVFFGNQGSCGCLILTLLFLKYQNLVVLNYSIVDLKLLKIYRSFDNGCYPLFAFSSIRG